MRILMINHGFFGGGAERCVRDLYHGLSQRGHQMHVWIANAPDNTAGNLPANVTPICKPWEHRLLPLDLLADKTDWRHRGSIQKLSTITPDKFDLIHLHHVGGGWLSLKALRDACGRVPSLWTHHDQWAVSDGYICDFNGVLPKEQVVSQMQGMNKLLGRSPYHDNFKNRSVGRLIENFAPRTPLLIAPSQWMLGQIKSTPRFASSSAVQIRNGVRMLDEPNCEMTQQQARDYWKLPKDRPVVLMLAAHLHDIHKGIALGLNAINNLHAANNANSSQSANSNLSAISPHILLLGKDTEALREHLPDSGVTTGYAADNAALAAAYRAANVTLIPSISDNFPFVALESLACHTPVCAFKVGGLSEMIGDNERGLLASPFDVNELSAHLKTLLTNETLNHKLANAGRQWVQDHCNMNLFLDTIEQTCIERIATFKR